MLVKIYFSLMGFMALLITLFIAVYALYHLIKKKSATGTFLFLGIVALFVIPYSFKMVVLSAAIILSANIVFYLTFTTRTLFRKNKFENPTDCPTISILIPAKNEVKVLEDTLLSLTEQNYPISKFEIIVIDDHSTDQTYELLMSLRNISNLKVIRNKQSLGKARALNEVLKTLSSEYVMILDADHLTEKLFIKKVLHHFRNPKVACVQGKNTIRNGRANLLSRLIQIEYFGRYEILYPGKTMAFFVGSGAMFRTKCLKEVNGFSENMLTEDLEVSYRLYENGNILVFDNTISTYELATEDFKNYYKQRHRWFRGIWQSFLTHCSCMTMSKSIPLAARIYFWHIIVENMALSSFLFFCVLFTLDFAGIKEFEHKNILYVKTITLAIIFALAVMKSRKPILFVYLLLMPFYYILYALPNFTAMIDNWIIRAEYKWIKTDRSQLNKRLNIKPVFVVAKQYSSEQETVETLFDISIHNK